MYICIGKAFAMERYGGAQATEGSPADPVGEWSSPEGGTGLEGKYNVTAFSSLQFRLNLGCMWWFELNFVMWGVF